MDVDDPNSLRYLSRDEVIAAIRGIDPVETVRQALEMHADGRTTLPDEAYLGWRTSGGLAARSLALPGAVWSEDPAVGMKVICGSLANPALGLPRAQGVILLFDRETAHPVTIMEAAYLSALRTSAYTALSVALLGPREPGRVAVIGCGALGEAHVRLLGERLPGARFRLYDRSSDRRDALVGKLSGAGLDCGPADSAESAIRDAGVVVTTTTTTTPYLRLAWLSPGALVAHVSLDDVYPEVVHQAGTVIVDDWSLVSGDRKRLLGRMYRRGELAGPDGETYGAAAAECRRVDATLGDVITGRHPGRRSPDRIVLSNPFGMGILDVALAAEVARVAAEDGPGLRLPI